LTVDDETRMAQMSLSRLSPGGGDDPVLGTYRAPRLYRLLCYATPFGSIVVLVLAVGPWGFLSRAPVQFVVAFVVGVLYSNSYFLWLATQRVVLSQEGIGQSALGTMKFIRYDDIVSIRRRNLDRFDVWRTTAFTRVGDGRGTRLLVPGPLSEYDVITQYLDSRIGGRELRWCPWTAIECFKWGTMGVFVVCMVWLLVSKQL
jgi:hypothetical protein